MSNNETKVIKAYKGFDKNLSCRGFVYEVGKEYELPEGENPMACERGFHACENPFDVLDYYGNGLENRYCEVEQSGIFKAGVEWLKEVTNPVEIIKDTKDAPAFVNDNGGYFAKIGSSGVSAKIGSSGGYAQIGSSGNFVQIGSSGDSAKIGSSGDSAKIGSSGDFAKIGSSGDYAKIGSSGVSAKIGSSGDYAQIDSTGEDSVICCAGHGSVVKAKQGSWITLAEWGYSKEEKRFVPKCVKTEYVDGERIKADTWYKLVDGEFVEQ